MSKDIILANIGNRNIKYLNQGYHNDEIPKDVFLSKTKFIWEHPEELENVHLSILPAIIEKYPQAIVYLFSTLQVPEFSQDTYYEGLIIQKMLVEQFPSLKVESIAIKGLRANSEDDLIPWYRGALNTIIKSVPDAFYIMYDTGGTPQQKNALKAVVEFCLKKNASETGTDDQQYKLYQGNDDQAGGTKIEEIKRTATERLNQLTNIKLLIQHNNYAAARQLALGIDNKTLVYILGYASHRWENMWNEVSRLYSANNLPRLIKTSEEWNSLTDEKNYLPEIYQSMSLSAARDCNNLISKTYNQQSAGNFSGAILAFHQFAETYIAGVIEANSDHQVYSNNRAGGITLIREIENDFLSDFISQFERPPSNASFPAQIFFALTLFEKGSLECNLINEIKEALSIFKIKNQYPQNKKLDSLRNSIAHDGQGVTESDYQLYADLIKKMYARFIPGDDPFKTINRLIESVM